MVAKPLKESGWWFEPWSGEYGSGAASDSRPTRIRTADLSSAVGCITIRPRFDVTAPSLPTAWFGCVLLGVDSLRGGLAEGNRIAVCRWFNGIWCVHKLLEQFSTLHRSKMENHLEERLLDQAQARVSYTPPPFLRSFA